MNVLLVHAHPVPESFNAALRAAAERGLARAGHTVDVQDLYAEGFDPRLSLDERRLYEAEHPSAAAPHDAMARLRAAEMLVLVFPTWWYGLPAILKGWFDRVWTPGVAFTLPGDGAVPRPALMRLRRIVAVTTYGSPRWWITVMGDPGQRVIRRGIRTLCAPRARSTWLALHGMDGADQARREKFLARVENRLAAL